MVMKCAPDGVARVSDASIVPVVSAVVAAARDLKRMTADKLFGLKVIKELINVSDDINTGKKDFEHILEHALEEGAQISFRCFWERYITKHNGSFCGVALVLILLGLDHFGVV